MTPKLIAYIKIKYLTKYGDQKQKRILPALKGQLKKFRREKLNYLETNLRRINALRNSSEIEYDIELLSFNRINIIEEKGYPQSKLYIF